MLGSNWSLTLTKRDGGEFIHEVHLLSKLLKCTSRISTLTENKDQWSELIDALIHDIHRCVRSLGIEFAKFGDNVRCTRLLN